MLQKLGGAYKGLREKLGGIDEKLLERNDNLDFANLTLSEAKRRLILALSSEKKAGALECLFQEASFLEQTLEHLLLLDA